MNSTKIEVLQGAQQLLFDVLDSIKLSSVGTTVYVLYGPTNTGTTSLLTAMSNFFDAIYDFKNPKRQKRDHGHDSTVIAIDHVEYIMNNYIMSSFIVINDIMF